MSRRVICDDCGGAGDVYIQGDAGRLVLAICSCCGGAGER